MTLGQALRAIRKANGLTLKQLSKRSGVGVSSLSEYEHGKREPRMSVLSKLCKVLNCSLAQVLAGGPRKATVLWCRDSTGESHN